MAWLYLVVFGSLLAGIALALLWWLIRGRKVALPSGSIRRFTLAAGLFLLMGEIVWRISSAYMLLPLQVAILMDGWQGNYRFVAPLVIGILGLILLSFPVQSRGGRGAAELAPRSFLSFAAARWFIFPSALLTLILLFTVLAGAASEPDETGRYMYYTMELGAGNSVGTTIYGWFYSIPSLILMGVLIAVTFVALFLIARPALAEDRRSDIKARTVRTRSILAAGTGALLLHLSAIFTDLAGTASLRFEYTTPDGPLPFWTSFSALAPALTIAGMGAAALGVALWASIALAAIPSSHGAAVPVGP